jgi:hypothetical protein
VFVIYFQDCFSYVENEQRDSKPYVFYECIVVSVRIHQVSSVHLASADNVIGMSF